MIVLLQAQPGGHLAERLTGSGLLCMKGVCRIRAAGGRHGVYLSSVKIHKMQRSWGL